MYYDEEIVNGVLGHRGAPDEPWIPFNSEQLTEKIINLRSDVELMKKLFEVQKELSDVWKERYFNYKGSDIEY